MNSRQQPFDVTLKSGWTGEMSGSLPRTHRPRDQDLKYQIARCVRAVAQLSQIE